MKLIRDRRLLLLVVVLFGLGIYFGSQYWFKSNSINVIQLADEGDPPHVKKALSFQVPPNYKAQKNWGLRAWIPYENHYEVSEFNDPNMISVLISRANKAEMRSSRIINRASKTLGELIAAKNDRETTKIFLGTDGNYVVVNDPGNFSSKLRVYRAFNDYSEVDYLVHKKLSDQIEQVDRVVMEKLRELQR